MAIFNKNKSKYGFFNCKEHKQSSKAIISLLRELGLEINELKETVSSGHAPKLAGYKEVFEKCKYHNLKVFKNVDYVISDCPHCVHTFRNDYNIKTKHFFEVLQEEAHKIRNVRGVKASYHHACYLNKLGISEKQVQNFLKKIGFVIEQILTDCCGSVGGDFERNFPSLSHKLAQKVAKKSELIITLCPFCVSLFKINNSKVVNLSELLSEI